MTDKSIENFIEELSSAAPAPGGGGAAALTGALASSLGLMVLNLTSGKKKFADIQNLVTELLNRLMKLRNELIDDIKFDEECFMPLARAYRLPSATEEEKQYKNREMQSALLKACQPPFKIMQDIEKTVDILTQIEQVGTKTAYSDTGAAAALAMAAVKAASLNVYINTATMDDVSRRSELNRQADALLKRVCDKCEDIFNKVKDSYL